MKTTSEMRGRFLNDYGFPDGTEIEDIFIPSLGSDGFWMYAIFAPDGEVSLMVHWPTKDQPRLMPPKTENPYSEMT